MPYKRMKRLLKVESVIRSYIIEINRIRLTNPKSEQWLIKIVSPSTQSENYIGIALSDKHFWFYV